MGLGQHGVVLELRLAERRGVLFTSALADEAEAADKTYAGNDDELGLSGAEGLEGRLVSEGNCGFQVSNCILELLQMVRAIAYLYRTS